MKGVNSMKKVLLYSGGMDSWLIKQLWEPDICLYIDIHGSYSNDEIRRLPEDVKIVDFPLLGEFELSNKFIPLRNLYFLMIASNYGDEICLGATSGDWGNKDKTPDFLDMSENILNYLWSDKKVCKKIKVNKDFINRSKTNLLMEYLSKGNDIKTVKESTFSCYTPKDGNECMECYPCFRKFAILYSFGYVYSKEEEYKMWEYIKQNIIPTKEQGGYQGTYYTDRGEESIYLIECVEGLKQKYGK